MPITSEIFRHVMGGFASGVTIVTTLHNNEPAGMTATAIASVSLNPLQILFCANRKSRTHEAIEASGIFAVNFLRDTMKPASDIFARGGVSDQERFGSVQYKSATTGSPILSEAIGWLDCRVAERYSGGDHTIFLGEVVDGGSNDGAPLLYYRGKYHELGEVVT